MKQQIVSASEFKAHCLEYIERANSGEKEYIVTKRCKPMVKLVAVKDTRKKFAFGSMKGTITIKGDIMAPIDVD